MAVLPYKITEDSSLEILKRHSTTLEQHPIAYTGNKGQLHAEPLSSSGIRVWQRGPISQNVRLDLARKGTTAVEDEAYRLQVLVILQIFAPSLSSNPSQLAGLARRRMESA